MLGKDTVHSVWDFTDSVLRSVIGVFPCFDRWKIRCLVQSSYCTFYWGIVKMVDGGITEYSVQGDG